MSDLSRGFNDWGAASFAPQFLITFSPMIYHSINLLQPVEYSKEKN